MVEPQNKQANKHPGLMLFLLSVVFIGPMLFAWIMYVKSSDLNISTDSHGELIKPALYTAQLSLEDNTSQLFSVDSLKGKWWLVYITPDQCYNACHDILYNMRQIHTALGKDADRVERMILTAKGKNIDPLSGFIHENYPEMKHAILTDLAYQQYFSTLSDPKDRDALGELVIIDPNGQLVMYYDGDTASKGILSDFKRLLRVSQIG